MEKCSCNSKNKNTNCAKCLSVYDLAKLEGRAKNMTLTEYLDSIEGEEGEQGVGIVNIVSNLDSSITFTLSDGTQFTTPPLKGDASNGASTLTSMVFKTVSNSVVPATPVGGNFNNPYPTDSTWTRTPSSGPFTYSSVRLFTSNGLPPQTPEWSLPVLLSSNSDMIVKWSSLEEYPGTPDTNPANFTDESDSNTNWMAIKYISNSIVSEWNVIYIRGDVGEKGEPGDSYEIRYAKNGSFTAPPSIDVTEREPVGWSLNVPSTVAGEYVWSTSTTIVGSTNALKFDWSIPIRLTSKDGDTGAPGSSLVINLTNDNSTVPAKADGTVLGPYPGTTAVIYLNGIEQTGWIFSASYTNVTGSIDNTTGVLTITNMSSDNGYVDISAQKGSATLVKRYTINKVRGGDDGLTPTIYYLEPSVQIVKITNNDVRIPESVSCKKIEYTFPSPPIETSLYQIKFVLDNGPELNYTGPVNVSAATKIEFRLYDGTDLIDFEIIPFVKDGTDGTDGESAFILDLTNQNSSVPASSTGDVQGTIPPTTGIVYKGNTVDTGWTFTAVFTNCTGTINSTSGLVTMSTMTADSASVEVRANKSGNAQLVAVYSLTKVRAANPGEDAVVYFLLPSVNSVKISSNGTIDPTTLSCSKMKRVGANEAVITTELSLRYVRNTDAEVNYTGPITISPTDSTYTFRLYSGSTLIDVETVPVLKDGSNGTDGENGSSLEAQYYVTNVGDPAPDVNAPTGWGAIPSSITNTQTLWERIRIIAPNGTPGPWNGPYKKTGDDGTSIQGASMAYRGDWSNIKQYSGSPYVVDVVKYIPNGKGYIARTDAGIIPVGTLPTNTTYWNEFTTDIDAVFTDFLFAYSGYIQNLTVGQLQTATEGERFTVGFLPTDTSDPTSDTAKFSRHGSRHYHESGKIAMYDGVVKNFQYTSGGTTKTVNGYARIVFKDEVNSPVLYVIDSNTTGGIQYVTATPDSYSPTQMKFVVGGTLTDAAIMNSLSSSSNVCGTFIENPNSVDPPLQAQVSVRATGTYYVFIPGSASSEVARIVLSEGNPAASNAIPDGWYLINASYITEVSVSYSEVIQRYRLTFNRYVAGIAVGEYEYRIVDVKAEIGPIWSMVTPAGQTGTISIYEGLSACSGGGTDIALNILTFYA